MAVLFVLAFGLDIFVLSGFLGAWFGVWGTLLHEIVLALLAVLLAALLRADLRSVFPFRRPRAVKTAGTLVLWLGTFLAAMAVTMLVSYFFPQEVMGASQDLQDLMVNIPVLLSLFLLFDQAFTALSLPFIFGMWLMFAGVSRVVNSLDLKAIGVRGWGWFTALGVLLAAAGFLSFLDPISGALTLSFLLGFLFLFQGLSALLRAIFSPRLFR